MSRIFLALYMLIAGLNAADYINVSGLPKTEVIQAFYVASRVVEESERVYFVEGPLSKEQLAEEARSDYIEIVNGRYIKIQFESKGLYVGAFNRQYGAGKGQGVVERLRARLTAENVAAR